MSTDLDFLEYCFSIMGNVSHKEITKHRHYLFVIYFKSENDSNDVNKIVIVDKNCDAKTMTLKNGHILANERIRQLSCIRVFWDEINGMTVESEQFHKGTTCEYSFPLIAPDAPFEFYSLGNLLDEVITETVRRK